MLAGRPNPSDTLHAWFRNAAKGAWERIGGLILASPQARIDFALYAMVDPNEGAARVNKLYGKAQRRRARTTQKGQA